MNKIRNNKERTDEIDIIFRIHKTRTMAESLNRILMSKEIEKQRKIMIYNTLIESTLMYGSELKNMKKEKRNNRNGRLMTS